MKRIACWMLVFCLTLTLGAAWAENPGDEGYYDELYLDTDEQGDPLEDEEPAEEPAAEGDLLIEEEEEPVSEAPADTAEDAETEAETAGEEIPE